MRALALVSFRDRIILPLFPRLHARLTMMPMPTRDRDRDRDRDRERDREENVRVLGSELHQARLQQMCVPMSIY